jgi:hypothetical protein
MIWDWLRRWRLARRIHGARQHGHAAELQDFVARDSTSRQELGQYFHRCRAENDDDGCLLAAVVLVRCDDPQAPALIEALLALPPRRAPWRGLERDELRDLERFVRATAGEPAVARLWTQLDDEQLAWLAPPSHDALRPAWWRETLQRDGQWVAAVDALSADTRRGAPETARMAREVLCAAWHEHCQYVGDQLTAGLPVRDDAVRKLYVLSLASDCWPREELLDGVVALLPSLHIDSLRPATGLLRRAASPRWTSELQRVWLSRLEPLVRQDPGASSAPRVDPEASAAASAMLHTLGVCAGHDPVRFEASAQRDLETHRAEILTEQNGLIDQYNQLAQQYQRDFREELIHSYRSSAEEAMLQSLRQLHEHIGRLHSQIERLDQELHHAQTPRGLLVRVVSDWQRYEVSIRQGALAGLHAWHELGKSRSGLDARTLQETRLAARGALGVPSASPRTAADSDHADTEGTGSAAAGADKDAEEPPSDHPNDEEAVAVARRRDFAERRVHVPFAAGQVELAAELQQGLEWMSTVFGDRPDQRWPVGEILRLVEALCEHLPEALVFLQRYPLRLMPIDVHKQLLGEYRLDGCRITLWTQYTPPLYVGPVNRRYLNLDDRSTPNSMGIYYRLFCEPRLALPVIYHEFLHYGGPAGDPRQGIANELEVLLREMLFARGLFARLRPGDDPRDLASYERSYVEAIHETGAGGLLRELLLDLSSMEVHSLLVRHIAQTYGGDRTPEEAEQLVRERILRENLMIEFSNRMETWCPDVRFPHLDSGETQETTDRFCAVLRCRARQTHRVTIERFETILRESATQEWLQAWYQYGQLDGAADQLIQGLIQDLAADVGLVVDRFDLRAADGPDASTTTPPWWDDSGTAECTEPSNHVADSQPLVQGT